MTETSVRYLPSPSIGQPRYPDDVDLRDVIRQGATMRFRITYSDDSWNLAGAADFDGRSSSVLRFGRIPVHQRDMVKDHLLLIGDPGLARTWAPGAAADNHATRRRAHWATARTAGNRTGRLLRLMDDLGMRSMRPSDWSALVDEARQRAITNPASKQAAMMSAETLARGAQVLREIHDLGRLQGREAPFGSRPWGVREINEAGLRGSR